MSVEPKKGACAATDNFPSVKDADTLEKPCLGRPFQLGMLYDCRKDSLIPGVTLWGSEALSKAVFTKPLETSDFEVITEDSLKEKTFRLDVDASLQLSILSGLVHVEGAAKFLNDRKSSQNQARVSLKYKSTTKFEQLTMDQLGHFEYTDAFDKDIATHVVTGVVYGADAFFVFDREVKEDEDIKKIHGSLKVKIGGLPGLKNLAIGGEGSVDINTGEKDEESRLQCKFYGDLILPKHPTTFNEAAEVCHNLPILLKGKSVTKKVWLYPLGKLDSRALRMVREISSKLIDELYTLIESLHDVTMRSNGLIRSEVCSNFSGLREGLEAIVGLIGGYRADLQKNLAALLPKVRGGGADEVMLAEILKENSSSPFSRQSLSSWIGGKEKEIKILAGYMKSLKQLKQVHLSFEPGEVDVVINDVDVQAILCFDFNITWGEDAHLAKMEAYLQKWEISQDKSSLQPWYKTPSVMGRLREQFVLFKNFTEVNRDRQGIKFIATNHDSELAIESDTVAIISLYESGCPTEFEPPDKPGKPQGTDVTHNSIQLKWANPKHGAGSIQCYTVAYQIATDSPSDQWQTIECSATEESALISCVPDTIYVCKVSANTAAGSSPESEISERIRTKMIIGQPGKPHASAEDVTYNSIKLTWDIPRVGANSVQSYTVSYRWVHDPPDQWCSKTNASNEPNALCSSLDSDKLYLFKVKAETTAGISSPESELSEAIETLPMPLSAEMLPFCVQIEDGSDPPVYQLPIFDVMRKKDIAKVQVGQEPTATVPTTTVTQNKVLMVVGATGAGKSTLINGIANYIMGVRWNDNFRFKLIAESTSNDQSKSQTSCITAYTFPKMNGSPLPYSLTVIDTPGFGDTGGLKRDEKITSQIKEFFRNEEEGIDQLHAIGFVTQASLARLTPTQRYIFDAILSVFGKDIGSNIHLMTTFADGQIPPVINAVKVAEVPFENHYKFNNSALFATRTTGGVVDELFWDLGIGSFKDFFAKFALMEPRSLHLTKEVLKEREQLETSIEGLQPQISAGLAERDRLHETEKALRQHETEIRDNKDFKITVTVTKRRMDKLPSGQFITTCMHCHFTCHKRCGIADDDKKYGCAAMSSGCCTVCPNKCTWQMHKNTPFEYVLYQEKETQTLKEIKSRHESAVTGKLEVEALIEKIKEKVSMIDEDVEAMIHQVKCSSERLQEIALKPNPLNQVDYIDLMIESEKLQKQPGWDGRVKGLQAARKKAEMMNKIVRKDVGSIYPTGQPPQKGWATRKFNAAVSWLTGSS